MSSEILNLTPIGIFRSSMIQPADAPSQGHLNQSNERGLIELNPGFNFEQALRGLGQMSHVWVLFWFHQKTSWKPMVQVPRGSSEKQGVFATRSPHRPNPIGLSLVRIDEVGERKIWVRDYDILDGTPILDLKPFHPEADVPTDLQSGWMEHLNDEEYHLLTSGLFEQQAAFLLSNGVKQLVPFCKQQLRFDPFNSDKKRVSKTSDSTGVLAYRTWRIHFSFAGYDIRLEFIQSGYSPQELSGEDDRWGDRELHLDFIRNFGGSF